jgi:hypothetical protein
LQQAAGVQASPDGSYEMFDYVISLREGIMDAWGGIIGAMKTDGKSKWYLCDDQPLLTIAQPLYFNNMSSQYSLFSISSGWIRIGAML